MTPSRPIRVAIALMLLALALGVLAVPRAKRTRWIRRILHRQSTPVADRMGLPSVMFWAWERPEDLRFLDPHEAGVGFLARSIYLQPHADVDDPEHGVLLRPRMQPLEVLPEQPLMAVVRIEVLPAKHSAATGAGSESVSSQPFSEAQRQRAAGLIVEAVRLPGVRALQIDFDATQSQQAFYRTLLQDVRQKLPPRMPLSITALASWCVGDSWLDDLPKGTVDEAVPMLFRLGVGSRNFAAFLQAGHDFTEPLCQGSIGVSTDEAFSQDLLQGKPAISHAWRARRVYVFPPRSLTKDQAAAVLDALHSWHE